MLKANTLSELYILMDKAGPGQLIALSSELFKKFMHDSTFVHNFEQSDHRIVSCENKDQAQALANFLWNEGERHRRDIEAINEDLGLLWIKWKAAPNCIRMFVKP